MALQVSAGAAERPLAGGQALDLLLCTLPGRMARPTKERGRGRKPFEARRFSKLPREELDKIDYKNVPLLQRFVTERGKICSRRLTGLSRRD